MIGSGFMSVGIALRYGAISLLGRQFRTEIVPREGDLVTRGIYAKQRHPSETGLLLICGGAGLLSASWLALVATSFVILPLVLWRLRLEERQLNRAFGSKYTRYRQRVGGLLPHLTTAG